MDTPKKFDILCYRYPESYRYYDTNDMDVDIMLLEDPKPCEVSKSIFCEDCNLPQPKRAKAIVIKDSERSRKWKISMFYIGVFCMHRCVYREGPSKIVIGK